MPDDVASRTRTEASPFTDDQSPCCAGLSQGKSNGLLEASPRVAARLKACACYGEAITLVPGVTVVMANNAKDYTGPGTNTYLVGEERLWIIDPGPACDQHLAAVRQAVAGRPVEAILVTHTHQDHSPGAKPMSCEFEAPVLSGPALDPDVLAATDEDVDPAYRPDRIVTDGEGLGQGRFALTAIATPGHFPNHFAYLLPKLGILFSGDHVMGWSTTVVVPPLGNLQDYLCSLDKMEAAAPALMLPSHGPAIEDPMGRLADIRAHRAKRHAQICTCLDQGIETPEIIVDHIYHGLTDTLKKAACGQVAAHMALEQTGKAKTFLTLEG